MESSNYQKILSVAQDLVQKQGFNAFSYKDLSNAIGIKTSSIHYYFPTKDDLGETLVKEYRKSFGHALEKIKETITDPREQINQYTELFLATLRQDGKICLCGMLASDHSTLNEKVQLQVREFFLENEKWLSVVLQKGKESGVFNFDGKAEEIAASFFAMLEGAMLVSRVFDDESRMKNISDCWMRSLVR